jgi:alpha-D-ribose 1-methylphosphonate 5-phosphate C-P lyase
MEKPQDVKFKTTVCAYCGKRQSWDKLVAAVTHPDANKAYVCADYQQCDGRSK